MPRFQPSQLLLLGFIFCFHAHAQPVNVSDIGNVSPVAKSADTVLQSHNSRAIEQSGNASSVHSIIIPNYTHDELEEVIQSALETFVTPGVSVAIVHQGNIIHQAGYGLRKQTAPEKVNPYTYFRLASLSKAFTAASVAKLVDMGKLDWHDKVTQHLPDFTLYNKRVTASFTILDLLTHRSGLVAGAGDSMIWPEPTGFTRQEIIHNLRYLTPKFSYQETYSYSNVSYITAAEIVAQVAGMPWSQFVDEHLFQPLNVQCYAGDMPESLLGNVAYPHGHNDTRGIYPIPRNAITGKEIISAAAGGVVCNANGMAQWIQALLNEAKTMRGEALFTVQQLEKMWQPQTEMPVYPRSRLMNNTTQKFYGIGWRIEDVDGYELISHTGTLSGYQAYAAMIPDLELGVVVLNNGSNYGVRSTIMQTILKAFINADIVAKNNDTETLDTRNWEAFFVKAQKEAEQRYLKRTYPEPKGSGTTLFSPDKYAGYYTDKWFSGFLIDMNTQGQLRIKSEKMSTLTGRLEPFDQHTWIVRWDNQNAAQDAFVYFKIEQNSVISFTMHPYQNKQEDDHEWRDMVFYK